MAIATANTADFAAALEAAKLEALYQFAYGLSHEINNPLANIATRAQTLLVDERDPDRRRKLATINQQAFRAHEMIADLMLFARPPMPRKERVDLAAVASRVVAEIGPLAAEQGTTIVSPAATAPLLATVDPTQIAVALRAIIQNSLEALGKEGRVDVEVTESKVQGPKSKVHAAHVSPPPPNPQSAIRNLQFQLIVTDTGPGIPPHIRPHIFDPFFSGREAGRGLGLGLSKAWRIVTAHGGSITVESPVTGTASSSGGAATGGAAFTIELSAE